jgi:light-regulated signal transduction histidine kinase (bacteriophytochrome)
LLPETPYYCKIVFSDNGIGFDPEYAEMIFQTFKRLHVKSEYKGAGIGLAICNKIAENHKGIITAHANEGEGATFEVYIKNG